MNTTHKAPAGELTGLSRVVAAFRKGSNAHAAPLPAFSPKANLSPLGFNFASIRASATTPIDAIRRLIASRNTEDHIAAKEAIERLGSNHPESIRLVRELFDSMTAKMPR